MRTVDPAVLANANQALQDQAPTDTYTVGPAADGTFIRQLPALEFASGKAHPP